ncbi:MAG: hypothetical protein Q7R64_04185 [bacterium]|nr:hypothetical protein [bacterium]
MKEKKLKPVLSLLVFLETVYLCLSLTMIYFTVFFPSPADKLAITSWVIFSYFLLPALLFKNVVVSTLKKGVLSKEDKMWLILRCSIYLLLTVYSYPLIVRV